MRPVFLGSVFLLLCAVHLTACRLKLNTLRGITKPFLMLTLAFWYLDAAIEPRVLIFAALILGMIGDIFLLFTENPYLMKGGMAAFGLGHICYIVSFIKDIGHSDPVVLVCTIAGYGILAAILYHSFRKIMPKAMIPPSAAYILLIFLMSASALLRFASEPSAGRFLAAAGSFLFILSDTLLTALLFKPDTKQGNFSVMLTYILAQALIAAGMADIFA